jgi:hypothetical protein
MIFLLKVLKPSGNSASESPSGPAFRTDYAPELCFRETCQGQGWRGQDSHRLDNTGLPGRVAQSELLAQGLSRMADPALQCFRLKIQR